MSLVSSSSLAAETAITYTESQIKSRVKKWDIPYTTMNGQYLFKRDDWDSGLVNQLTQATKKKESRKRKAKSGTTTPKKKAG